MKVLVTQPNYIPWKGYFDLIAKVDKFVVLDDVQYTKRDWRNRNYVRFKNNKKVLTIPVKTKKKYYQKINETIIFDKEEFIKTHLRIFEDYYSKSKYFYEIYNFLKKTYYKSKTDILSDNTINITKDIAKYLGIEAQFKNSSSLKIQNTSSERILEICKRENISNYLTGKKALSYLNLKSFQKNNINIYIISYQKQKKYKQIQRDFIEKLSIVDLLFNCGQSSSEYLQDVKIEKI